MLRSTNPAPNTIRPPTPPSPTRPITPPPPPPPPSTSQPLFNTTTGIQAESRVSYTALLYLIKNV